MKLGVSAYSWADFSSDALAERDDDPPPSSVELDSFSSMPALALLVEVRGESAQNGVES